MQAARSSDTTHMHDNPRDVTNTTYTDSKKCTNVSRSIELFLKPRLDIAERDTAPDGYTRTLNPTYDSLTSKACPNKLLARPKVASRLLLTLSLTITAST